MTALAQDRKTDKLGADDTVEPLLLQFPVEASTSIYGGALVAVNASGNAVPASASAALKIVGRCEKQALNLATGGSPGATGAAGSITVMVRQGAFVFNINTDGGSITAGSFGANVYASDDNTVSLSDLGGTRPLVGFITAAPSTMTLTSTQVGVQVGTPSPYAVNPLANFATQYKARAVVTSLAAYTGTGTGTLTGSANGAIGAQDGVTLAVGDVIFIQTGITNVVGALDSGPWQVNVLGTGSVKYVLVRPDWWVHGSTIIQGAVIDIGGEGTNYAGAQFKSFAAASLLIGTGDPAFFIKQFVTSVTLVTGFAKLGPSQSFPGLRSLTQTNITFIPTNFSGASTTVSYRTGAYASGGSATATGALGTSTVSITALVAAGTFNTNDVGTGLLTIQNY